MLLQHHRAQLHTLLGLYAMSMSCMEAAESQFNCALRTSKERELWTFSNLNLATVYLRQRRDRDFMALLDRISPDQLPSASHCMKAAAYYIHGLQSFFSSQYGESKRYLRETLKMPNQEDLNRLTSCSLVLLGHIFLSLNNPKESMNMVTPAMQLAGKIPDVNVQLWATAILKDLYRLSGNPAQVAAQDKSHTEFSQKLIKDHFDANSQKEHQLINWTDGAFPQL
jgi:MAternally-affected-uncoordination protein